MPSRTVVNNRTVVHAQSIGIATAFPDACKTPTPGGPVPIPYPNIAMSKDAQSTAKKVKSDGQGICIQGSNFMMSQGDEAGSALGVASNRIKGKAEFQNFSFDVKAEGKMIPRLADPMTQNAGSTPNAMTPAEGQPGVAGAGAGPGSGSASGAGGEGPEDEEGPEKGEKGDQEACDSLKGKKQPPSGKSMDDVFKDHGMLPEDGAAFMKTCESTGVSATVRGTNPECAKFIQDGFPTKPMGHAGGSLKPDNLGGMPSDCAGLVANKGEGGAIAGIATSDGRTLTPDMVNAAHENTGGGDAFKGWLKDQGALTGDYDMHDMFNEGGRVPNGGEGWFNDEINSAIGKTDADTRMVQHGPQSNFKDYLDSTGKTLEPGKEKYLLPDVAQKPPESLLHFDSNGNVYKIDSTDELKALYKCKGAEYPSHWP